MITQRSHTPPYMWSSRMLYCLEISFTVPDCQNANPIDCLRCLIHVANLGLICFTNDSSESLDRICQVHSWLITIYLQPDSTWKYAIIKWSHQNIVSAESTSPYQNDPWCNYKTNIGYRVRMSSLQSHHTINELFQIGLHRSGCVYLERTSKGLAHVTYLILVSMSWMNTRYQLLVLLLCNSALCFKTWFQWG